ncbi:MULTISPECIES: ABC transporter ATP-binding protein [unclassified Nocardioides]|jgi:peptide/nickel transport system ATP-binding protein|uniref:ABC transporter ATP-binding protein n=1 Tax=unclassified Nocardioides TaxID=2615069 RepID=UPI000703B40D|nr:MULTISPECIES: ABC transporter ATP-binding protein [unclassified Nocardioides]KRC49014.1 peptide ABC transporter ATP-binding protein [Nocardioides sp. Root79]KRC75415.1 peptide ABC transporter ATP-binding protein [Nocardioides sp. Root240]
MTTSVTPAATSAGTAAETFLSVRDLMVHFPTSDGLVKSVDGLSFDLQRGQTLGIVGESGSGKSVSSMAIMGLHWGTGAKISGQIVLDGTDLLELTPDQMRRKRGQDVAMIFQDPLSAMHPYFTVGNQIMEAYQVHNDVSKGDAKKRAIEMLDRVGIPNPDRRFSDYPHQFSGGMRQRAMIAMGLINNPGLLIADEPTTALDVTVQAQILDLLQDLQREFNSAIIIITHDLGVVAEMADDVLVMYAGRAVEHGPCRELLTHPEMPYTWGLLSSVPDVTGDTDARLIPIPGSPPSLLNPPTGCAFHPRCLHRDKVPGDLCRTTMPDLVPGQRGAHHTKRCHLADSDSIYQTEVLPEIAPDLAEEPAGPLVGEAPEEQR